MKQQNGSVPEYDTYLFDADGTLIDTVDLVTECFLKTAEVFKDLLTAGTSVEASGVKSLMGLPLRYQMELFFGKMSDEQYEQVHGFYSRHQYSIYRDYLSAFPGVREGLAGLKSTGKKLGIVTSRRMESLRCYTKAVGIDGYFDEFITPEATSKHKPDPEPVLEAVRRLNTGIKKTVFVGDALFDIQSGRRAGVDTVFVNWSHNRVSDLETQPDYCIDSMGDLLRFFSSPAI